MAHRRDTFLPAGHEVRQRPAAGRHSRPCRSCARARRDQPQDQRVTVQAGRGTSAQGRAAPNHRRRCPAIDSMRRAWFDGLVVSMAVATTARPAAAAIVLCGARDRRRGTRNRRRAGAWRVPGRRPADHRQRAFASVPLRRARPAPSRARWRRDHGDLRGSAWVNACGTPRANTADPCISVHEPRAWRSKAPPYPDAEHRDGDGATAGSASRYSARADHGADARYGARRRADALAICIQSRAPGSISTPTCRRCRRVIASTAHRPRSGYAQTLVSAWS